MNHHALRRGAFRRMAAAGGANYERKWRVSEREALATWGHIARSSCCTIDKARRLIGYEPQDNSLEGIRLSVWRSTIKLETLRLQEACSCRG